MLFDWKTRRLARSYHTSCPYWRHVGRLHRSPARLCPGPRGPPTWDSDRSSEALGDVYRMETAEVKSEGAKKLGPHSVAFLCDSNGPKLGTEMN